MSGKTKQGGKGTQSKAEKSNETEELKKAKDKIVSLEGKVKKLQDLVKNEKNLQEEVKRLTVRVLSLEYDFNYEEVRRRLPESMDRDGIFATENARLVNEVKRLEEELQKSKQSTSAGQSTTVNVNVSTASHPVERQKSDLMRKNERISTLPNQVTQIAGQSTTVNVNVSTASHPVERQKSDLKRKDEQIPTLTNQLKQIEDSNLKMKEELISMENKIKELENTNRGLEQERKQITKHNENNKCRKMILRSLKYCITKWGILPNGKETDLKGEVDQDDLANKIMQLENKNEDLEVQREQAFTQIKQLEAKISELKEEREKTTKAMADLENNIEDLKAKLSRATDLNKGSTEDTQLSIKDTTPKHTQEIEDLKSRLDDAEKNISLLKGEKTNIETKMKDTEETIEGLRKEKTAIEIKMKDTEKRLEVLKKEKTDSEIQLSEVEKEYKAAYNSLMSKMKDTEKRLEVLTKEKTDFEMKLSEKEKEYISKQNSLKRENSNLKERINQLKNDKDNLEKRTSMKASIKELEEENETLKRRLSQMAGAQLLTNNPNIADLSDSNRPTKLAEQYSELYDNEWTNAYEVLESQGKSETEIIKKLHERILGIYQHCSNLAKQYGEKLNAMVIGAEGKTIKDDDIPPTKLRQLKDVRKAFGPEMAETVIKKYMEKAPNEGENMNAYIKKCMTLCWFMSVQDPPVALDTKKHTGTFNGDIFKTYTKSGKTLDYVVWPPLYLHEGGPMLCKGVAQGK